MALSINLDELRQLSTRDKYLLDPVSWVRSRLGEHLWSKQQDIIRAVSRHRRVAVHSCHSSGKSFLAARIALWWIDSHPPGQAFVVTSASSFKQVRTILWREMGRAHAKGDLPGRLNQTEYWLPMPAGNEEQVGGGWKPDDNDPTAFLGIHTKHVLVIFDEAGGILSPLWVAAGSLVSNEYSRFLAIGNPDDPTSYFADVSKPGSGWHVMGISAFDTPNLTGEPVPAHLRDLLISPTYIDEMRHEWGETNPYWVSKVLGRFPEVTTDGIIPISWVKSAQDREITPSDDDDNELGIDVGAGGDRNIIAHRRGGKVRIILRNVHPDTMVHCGNIINAIKRTGATVAKIDAYTIGQGIVDRAREIAADTTQDPFTRSAARRIIPVKVGMPPHNKERFLNLRAEGFTGLRERFQEGLIDIDPADETLAAQLVDLRFKPNSSGRTQIESKEEIKRRGKNSPDEADAVMLAFLKPSRGKKVKLAWGT